MKHWGITGQRTAEPRFILALIAALAAVTCAKAEDQATPGNSGGGGSNGGLTTNGVMGTSVQNTTTVSTANGTTATTGASSGSPTSASTSTTGGGNEGGEAGAPSETTGTDGGNGTGGNGGDGGNGGSSTETSTDGVPPDVIENASVVLLYKIDSSTANTASIFMHLYLRNQSDDPFPLGAAEVRYWLDADGRGYTMASHYQGPGIGAVTLSKGSSGDDDYVGVTFTDKNLAPNTGDINPNEFQLKLDASGGNFDQSDDYSFEPSYTSATEHDRVTVYLADQLVWGCEPSGACAGDDPGAGGAAGAAGAAP